MISPNAFWSNIVVSPPELFSKKVPDNKSSVGKMCKLTLEQRFLSVLKTRRSSSRNDGDCCCCNNNNCCCCCSCGILSNVGSIMMTGESWGSRLGNIFDREWPWFFCWPVDVVVIVPPLGAAAAACTMDCVSRVVFLFLTSSVWVSNVGFGFLGISSDAALGELSLDVSLDANFRGMPPSSIVGAVFSVFSVEDFVIRTFWLFLVFRNMRMTVLFPSSTAASFLSSSSSSSMMRRRLLEDMMVWLRIWSDLMTKLTRWNCKTEMWVDGL